MSKQENTVLLLTELRSRWVEFEAGETVLTEGETSGNMYRVEDGTLEVLRTASDGVQHRLGIIEPGHIVGEISMFTGQPNSATVRTLEPCTLLLVTQADFDELVAESSTLLERLLQKVVKNLSRTVKSLSDATLDGLQKELQFERMKAANASFLVHMLLGFSGYALVMKWLSDNTSPLANATVVTGPMMVLMAIVAISFARRSGMPRRAFGLRMDRWKQDIVEGVVLTIPVLAVLTGVKWALIQLVPAYADQHLFPPLHEPFTWGPIVGYGVYSLLVPLQEFLSRGVIQGPIYDVLTGSRRVRTFWSIVVSNTLFAVTHLHLTIGYGAAAFSLGLFWGWIYARRRSLWVPSASHIVVGVWALYVLGFASMLKGLT